MSLLKTTPVSSVDDVRRFFDAFAQHNIEQHGKAAKLLNYRISLLKKYADFKYSDEVLDIGCGNGHHLFSLDGFFRSGTGIDIAKGMVNAAEHSVPANASSTYSFLVDDAQSLLGIPDQSKDVVFCVGALEHMFDKVSVLSAAKRVLRPGGRFVCLTLNDQFIWYRTLAPLLGYATRHLATDHRLDQSQAQALLEQTGFKSTKIGYWTFVPQGDMPAMCAKLCKVIDLLGHIGAARYLRGGLVLSGVK
ncbi:MAG: class I SAM-dependent methyltransferase [Rhodothermales bacterium]